MLRNSKRSFRELKAASVRHTVLLCPSHSSAQLHRATCYLREGKKPSEIPPEGEYSHAIVTHLFKMIPHLLSC